MNSKEARFYANELMKNRNYCEISRANIMRNIELEFDLCDDVCQSRLNQLILGAKNGKNQTITEQKKTERTLKIVRS